MNLKLKMIAKEITSGKCLVILGPRLLTGEAPNLNARLNSYLSQELGDDIELSYYTEDGFLNFNAEDITWVAEGIKHFYEDEVEPNEVYQKLADIPFPLIINTSPDKLLNKIFDEKGRAYDYDYFKMREPASVVRRKQNTLIYNIFGDYEDVESLVLTFRDLTTYMVAITNLKKQIKIALSDAKAVLFFGFDYEKWYFQLLLSFLKLDQSEKGGVKRKSGGKMKNAWDVPKDSIKNFYMKEFNVKFFSDHTAHEIIDQLHQASTEGLIQPPEKKKVKLPDIYISYSHREKSNEVADKVEESFRANKIPFIRDKSDLEMKERISKFMKQIGKAQGVVVIISDAYLRSKYCMFELVEIYQNKNFEKRIFPIFMADAKIFKSEDLLDYKNHWKQEMENLDSKATDASAYETVRDEYNLYKQFHDSFDEIFKILPDIKSVTQQEAEASEFGAFIEQIKDMAQ